MVTLNRICIICARGGSKGVPRKNIRMIAGLPLIAHTIRHALRAGIFDRIVVSSDDDEILNVATEHGAHSLMRPAELATDEAGAIPAIEHALVTMEQKTSCKYDTVVVLQATSPIRLPEDIVNAVRLLENNKAHNVLSVCEASASPYYTLIEKADGGGYALCKSSDAIRRQDVPLVYELNGSIYVWDRNYFVEQKKPLNEKTEIYVMPEERSIDIDTELDFKIANFLMEEMQKTDSSAA